MRRLLKILLKIFISIILLIILTFIIVHIPIKKAVKINTVESKVEYITSKDTRIFCSYDSGCTGPVWLVIGKGNTMFTGASEKTPLEYVELTGNRPKKINLDMGDSVFVFEGTYVGERQASYESEKHRVFNVKKWDVLYPIKREYGIIQPKSIMNIADLINSEEVSSY